MWTDHPAMMAILWIASQLIIGWLAYCQGRKDERLEWLLGLASRKERP